MKKLAIVAGLVLLAVPVFAGEIVALSSSERSRIAGEFIVTFKPGVEVRGAAEALARAHGAEVVRQWTVIPGVLMKNLPDVAALTIVENPNVALVEPNEIVSLGPPLQSLDGLTAKGDQANPTWGIDRIDERDLPDDNNYHWDYDGTGVTAFILDTGIRTTHVDFGGRASWGIDCTGEGAYDGYGHGTHVAGTVGSATYGVAKNVTLVAVKICTSGGSCPTAAIICGIDYATAQKQASPSTPMLANIAIGTSYSQSMNDAVTNSIAAGVFYAVPAGNSYANACYYSPGSTPNAMTVGATTSADARASFSNYGLCLDIFAPGSSILSTYNASDTATATMSGTNMASPHVAGAAALVLHQYPAYTPAQATQELLNRATTGRVTNPGIGSPNRLLYTLDDRPDCPGWWQMVDDSDFNVHLGGPLPRWWEVTGYGYSNQMHYTWNVPTPEESTNYVYWFFDVPENNNYEVEVFIPSNHATTTNAGYYVHDGAEWHGPYVVNQYIHYDEWVTLTSSIFLHAGSRMVYLGDYTGEPTGTRKLGVDAVRVSCKSIPDPQPLTFTKAGNGFGTVTSIPPAIACDPNCSEQMVLLDGGTVLTLTATPDPGSSTFVGWSGACTGTGDCQVTMDGGKTVIGEFTLTARTLTVNKTGDGLGTVTSEPAGINCGSACGGTYEHGTVVTLTATAGTGVFVGWRPGEDCSDGVVTMVSDLTCAAEFALPLFADGFESGDLSKWSGSSAAGVVADR